ncbi:Protein halfway [Operophtera brumata]|uniref:Protein halfway n=1 Tax=Operophtera brumata TaxID=104452 RepID=A0A0L7LH14_OPEBR|nr:Protein halfway [Operophtera brumata]
MRVEESEPTREAPREAPREQPPHTPTVEPDPIEQYLYMGKCFKMSREDCPQKDRCKLVVGTTATALFCCDIDSAYLKETFGQNSHVPPAGIDGFHRWIYRQDYCMTELDVSQAMFRRLASMAFTDGSIDKIIGQFPKYSAVACLNISNNNLTSAKLQPSKQRPFAYLFNLTVLDASANNLTEFPLSLVHSNRKISVDLSGNNYLPCKHFQKAMETNNVSLVTFLNYNDTNCALDLSFNWFKDVAVDCSYRNLTEMPTNLPPNTVQLNVSYNNITSLQPVSDDPTYDHLRRLILDHNDIPNILELEGTKFLLCQGMGSVVDLVESQVCHTPRDWTDYIYYIIGLEVLILVLLVSKVSYDYWVFKTAGYLPWPANKMPRLPCDWLFQIATWISYQKGWVALHQMR